MTNAPSTLVIDPFDPIAVHDLLCQWFNFLFLYFRPSSSSSGSLISISDPINNHPPALVQAQDHVPDQIIQDLPLFHEPASLPILEILPDPLKSPSTYMVITATMYLISFHIPCMISWATTLFLTHTKPSFSTFPSTLSPSSFIRQLNFQSGTGHKRWDPSLIIYQHKVIGSLPPDKTPIDWKWVFKTKSNPNGTIERHKFRLIAKRYT